MGYKSIVVYLNDSSQNLYCLDYAIRMAQYHQAHLTGVYGVNSLPYLYLSPYNSYDIVQLANEKMQERQEHSKKLFTEMVSKAGIAFDWYTLSDTIQDSIQHFTCTADLAIVMQNEGEEGEYYVPQELPEIVLLRGGRPVLFIPYLKPDFLPEYFNTIAIAWNGTRESARAVSDAYPLLRQAKNVVVLTASVKEDKRSKHLLPDHAITSYLSRHNIKAELVNAQMESSETGQWILSQTLIHNVDLLISGAYGHSRLYETIWGGVTHTLLRTMHTPVLMSN